MAEHRAAWSAAWGVLAAVFGTGAAALWIALTTGGSWWFLLPAVICSVIAAVGLYSAFGVLGRWWPFNALDEMPEAHAHAPDPTLTPLPVALTPARAEDSPRPLFDQAPPELADMSPASVKELLVGRTEAQRKTLMRQHVGKPVHVSGEVDDVSLATSYRGSVRLRGESGFLFLLLFDLDDEDPGGQLLVAINPGERLVVSGVINEIQANLVALDNCKMIDLRGPVS
jgi:hypothetical protein